MTEIWAPKEVPPAVCLRWRLGLIELQTSWEGSNWSSVDPYDRQHADLKNPAKWHERLKVRARPDE